MTANALTILGCSSGDPQPGRATSGYLLQTGESLSLLDCGSGIVANFLKRGFDPLKLDGIFISHSHSDHIADLTLMIQKIFLTRRENMLTLYLPNELTEPFESWLRAVYLIKERFAFELKLIGYGPGMVFTGAFSLSAIANSHFAGAADIVKQLGLPNKLQSFSFSIQTNTSSLLYSADLGSFDDINDEIESHAHVIVECTHINLNNFFETATRLPNTQFVLTHLGSKEEIVSLRSRVEHSGCKNVRLAEEGMRIEL